MRVLDFIVCDDIRHEIGKKFSLMGVLTDSIQVVVAESGKPFLLRIGLFARVLLEANDLFPDSLRLTIRRGEEEVFSAASEIGGDGDKRRIDIVVKLEHRFSDFGEYTFEISLKSGDSQVGSPFDQSIRLLPASPEQQATA